MPSVVYLVDLIEDYGWANNMFKSEGKNFRSWRKVEKFMWDILEKLMESRNAFKKRKLTLDGESWSSPGLHQVLALLP